MWTVILIEVMGRTRAHWPDRVPACSGQHWQLNDNQYGTQRTSWGRTTTLRLPTLDLPMCLHKGRPLRMLAATVIAVACGPSPDALRADVAAGRLDQALPVVATASVEGPLGPLVPLARRWMDLQPVLEALKNAEGPMLQESVEQAMAQQDWVQAAARLDTARRAHALDDATLVALSNRIETQARTEAPATTHDVLTTLAEVWHDREGRCSRLRQDAVLAAVEARYSPERIQAVRASQHGITVAAAEALLRRLDRAYVVEVDWTAALRRATARLGALAATQGAVAEWPALSEVVFTGGAADNVDAAIAGLHRSVKLGETAAVPTEVLVDEWVAGALSSLDPWTRAVWPAELASWQEGHAGVYAGVGLELALDGAGGVRVVLPLLGTPAWQADLHQDDLLIAVSDGHGKVVFTDLPADRRLAAAQAALRGPLDSAVRLELLREGVGTVNVELRRAGVVEETVEGWRRGDADNRWEVLLPPGPRASAPSAHGLAHVRIPRFKPTTEAAFDDLLEPFLDEVYGVVIDLRGNPGGDINSAVQIADRFVADGWLAELDGRVLPDTGPDVDPATGQSLAEWNQAIPGHALEGVQVAVLVDEDTASAAEVLAGALQERAGAVVLGTATWGKGRAQALRTADDGSHGVQFTNVVWALPSGRRLDRTLDGGITPSVVVELGPASTWQIGQQRQVRTALKVHRDGTPLRQPQPSLREGLPPLQEDPAVLAAELVLRARLMSPEG